VSIECLGTFLLNNKRIAIKPRKDRKVIHLDLALEATYCRFIYENSRWGPEIMIY